MHPVVFSKEWFERHQSKLLWLLNHWLTRRWFRWVLRIRRHDIGYDKPIVELFPHAYTVLIRELEDGRVELATDFRTHPKYAKRLYYAFKPVWWMAHCCDWLLADRFVPELSFGCSTLTLFPDVSSGGVTCDGQVSRDGVDEVFLSISIGFGTTATTGASTGTIGLTATITTDQFSSNSRLLFGFDTRILSDSSSVTQTALSVWGTSKSTGLGAPRLRVMGATPANYSQLITSDYSESIWNNDGVIIENASFDGTNTVYTTVNATSYWVSARLPTVFTVVNEWDYQGDFSGQGGTWASGLTTSFAMNMADATGVSQDPKLVITFTQPASITFKTMRPGMFRPGNAR